MQYKHLELSYLERMAGGDAEDRRQLLKMLVQDLAEYPDKMQTSFQNEDWPRLEKQAHYFKSTLPFTGYQKLIDLNQSLHQSLRTGKRAADLPGLLQQIKKESQAVLVEAQRALEQE